MTFDINLQKSRGEASLKGLFRESGLNDLFKVAVFIIDVAGARLTGFLWDSSRPVPLKESGPRSIYLHLSTCISD